MQVVIITIDSLNKCKSYNNVCVVDHCYTRGRARGVNASGHTLLEQIHASDINKYTRYKRADQLIETIHAQYHLRTSAYSLTQLQIAA